MKMIIFIFLVVSFEVFVPPSARMSTREFILHVYDIDLSTEVDTGGNVMMLNNRTVICKLSQDEIKKLLSKTIPGYSGWRKVGPEESYGNRDIVIDGFVERSLFEARRITKGIEQQIIVDTASGRVVLINI